VTNKTQLIVLGLLFIVVVIATVLITKASIGNPNNELIEQLQQENTASYNRIEQLEKLLIENNKLKNKEVKKRDSIAEVNALLLQERLALNKELKNVKGKYKKFSNDSLYKELIEVYRLDSIRRNSN
jgi:cytoskeletal protein RodZ